jgi:hypothetical protein
MRPARRDDQLDVSPSLSERRPPILVLLKDFVPGTALAIDHDCIAYVPTKKAFTEGSYEIVKYSVISNCLLCRAALSSA